MLSGKLTKLHRLEGNFERCRFETEGNLNLLYSMSCIPRLKNDKDHKVNMVPCPNTMFSVVVFFYVVFFSPFFLKE